VLVLSSSSLSHAHCNTTFKCFVNAELHVSTQACHLQVSLGCTQVVTNLNATIGCNYFL
jgi:hypothetical protein